MKIKKVLIIALLTLSVSLLAGCTNSPKETSLKDNNIVKSEADADSKDNKSAEDDSIIFKSKIGLSIKFPSNWKDRYTIKEDDNSIYVYFKSTDPKTRANTGLLLVIIKDFDEEDESMYDSIDGEKHFSVGNKTYFVGGPTDVSLNPENKDFDIFVAMSNERKKVIDNISLT